MRNGAFRGSPVWWGAVMSLVAATVPSPLMAQVSEQSVLSAQAVAQDVASSKEKTVLYCRWSAESRLTLEAIRRGDLPDLETHNAKANIAYSKLGPAFDEARRTYNLSYPHRAELAKGLYDAWSELDRRCPGPGESKSREPIRNHKGLIFDAPTLISGAKSRALHTDYQR
jgi:hypothetical protein